jgi:hypothetical protein
VEVLENKPDIYEAKMFENPFLMAAEVLSVFLYFVCVIV